MSIPLVFIDANVLLPEYLRTVMLDLADAGLLVPHWSLEVMIEVRRNLVSDRFGVEPAKADRLIKLLGVAFPGALIEDYDRYKTRFVTKVDPKDVHVAAAAYKLSRSVRHGVTLVSNNLKDLPSEAFAGTNISTARPDSFLEVLLRAQPMGVAETLMSTCRRLKHPPIAPEDLLSILEHSGCAGFAGSLAATWGYSQV